MIYSSLAFVFMRAAVGDKQPSSNCSFSTLKVFWESRSEPYNFPLLLAHQHPQEKPSFFSVYYKVRKPWKTQLKCIKGGYKRHKSIVAEGAHKRDRTVIWIHHVLKHSRPLSVLFLRFCGRTSVGQTIQNFPNELQPSTEPFKKH